MACKRLIGRSRRSITCVPHQQSKGVRATWFGDGQCPRSSILCAPEALPVRCSRPLRRLASEKDHLPLGLEFDCVRLAGRSRGNVRPGTLPQLMERMSVGTGRTSWQHLSNESKRKKRSGHLSFNSTQMRDNKALVETRQKFFKKNRFFLRQE